MCLTSGTVHIVHILYIHVSAYQCSGLMGPLLKGAVKVLSKAARQLLNKYIKSNVSPSQVLTLMEVHEGGIWEDGEVNAPFSFMNVPIIPC